MIVGIFIIFGFYVIVMATLLVIFIKTPLFKSLNEFPKTGFSIIIPFRNESPNLAQLLNSISILNYPAALFEIIFVNDASEDSSEKMVLDAIDHIPFSIKLLQNERVSNSPKKDALSHGISHSRYEWVITTDADCELPKNWLKTLDAFIQMESAQDIKPVMICGPILYRSNGSFLQDFQQIDAFSLQGVTIGSLGLGKPIMNNGANLAYRKDSFVKVNGFLQNDHIASGDDIFLLEKMRRKFPGGIKFLKSKDAVVVTVPQPSWKEIIHQRIRWASKTSKQKNGIALILGILVFLVNLSFFLIPVLILFYPQRWVVLLFLIIVKMATDFLVIRSTGAFFDKKISFWNFVWMSFVYSPITICVVVGNLAGRYSWKGRHY